MAVRRRCRARRRADGRPQALPRSAAGRPYSENRDAAQAVETHGADLTQKGPSELGAGAPIVLST